MAAAALLGYAGLALAAGNDPGSSSDPLVSKSYVENYVAQYVQNALKAIPGNGGGNSQWQVKTVPAGQAFTGAAGAEFILRSGQALAVDPTGSGMPDLTAGSNLTAGRAVAANHLYLVPRADGRGFKAQTNVVIMYMGQ
ncbi:hypothetical protein A6M21_15390 [Desulfotomaculum copahuensis]|uniref:Uncharacterized protein n=2 Tax=Desulfotomaculum copahuensis TaxID=1838280 RepID=A0A1B7LBD7_9FIRM|nr:hypothetical protein A6M21_15390 [Desulfotomaculum copahuensis]